MPEPESGTSSVAVRWLLENVPFTTFFCENDALYTMRFIAAGNGEVFGYDPQDFINNRHYFAASTIHPEDQDIVDAHAEQAAAGGSPVVSRYRLVQADGDPVPILMVSRGVLDEKGDVLGFAGCAIDLRIAPSLQGKAGLLSERRVPELRRPPATRSDKPDAAWVADALPTITFFTENDAHYTVRANLGSLEELLGYSAAHFVESKIYKAASTVHPADQDIADGYIESAARGVGSLSVARFRLVNSEGGLVPVLIFARGARPGEGSDVGVAGGVLDISHVPALQGPWGLLVGGEE